MTTNNRKGPLPAFEPPGEVWYLSRRLVRSGTRVIDIWGAFYETREQAEAQLKRFRASPAGQLLPASHRPEPPPLPLRLSALPARRVSDPGSPFSTPGARSAAD